VANFSPVGRAERKRIVALLREGKSYRQIRKVIPRGNATISKIAKEEGIDFDSRNCAKTAAATEARKAFSAESRAEFGVALFEKMQRTLERIEAPYDMVDFSAAHGEHYEHHLDRPDARSTDYLYKSVTSGMKAILDIDRHDNRVSDTSAVEMWLDALKRDPR